MNFWIDRPEEETQRVFKLKNGMRVFFKKIPPYGFWTVSFERGAIPDSLKGSYTSFKRLYDQVDYHVRNRKQYATEIVEEVLPDGP